MKKILFIVTGFISLGLGVIGAVLPLLPTVPFLLLAAFCFARGSVRLNDWFINTVIYQKHLASYVRGEGMTAGTKSKIMLTVTIMLTIGFIMMSGTIIGRVVLVVVWICHMIYFLRFVKTI